MIETFNFQSSDIFVILIFYISTDSVSYKSIVRRNKGENLSLNIVAVNHLKKFVLQCYNGKFSNWGYSYSWAHAT